MLDQSPSTLGQVSHMSSPMEDITRPTVVHGFEVVDQSQDVSVAHGHLFKYSDLVAHLRGSATDPRTVGLDLPYARGQP